MRYLVTGGAGFIGSSIVDRLLADGHSVRVMDNFDPYYDPSLKRGNVAPYLGNKDFELMEADIRDRKAMAKAVKDVDIIIHEAAQPGVSVSVKDPVKSVDVNVTGTAGVLAAAKDAGIKRVVFASSSSVYGKAEYLPFDEKHPTVPISPYGASKVSCEHLCRVFSDLYGMTIPQLRYFTVYGPRLRPDLAINIFMRKAMGNEDIVVFGDGSKSRSFTYIDDIVRATLLAAGKGKTGPYNIGGELRITIKDLVGKIMRITGSSSRILYKENVLGDMEHTMAKNDKARKELGWEPKVLMDRGLENYYRWLKETGKGK